MAERIFKKSYQDKKIAFTFDGETILASNIVYEEFHRSIPMHTHSDNSYEIHFIQRGTGWAIIEGKEYILGENTLYITGPHVAHAQITNEEDPVTEYCVYLKLADKRSKRAPDTSVLQAFRNRSLWFGNDNNRVGPIMEALFYELDNQSIGYKTQVESLLNQLIIACVRNYTEGVHDVALETIQPMDHQYLLIEECFLYEYNTITLTELSRRLGLSPRQTERLLLSHYGKSFQNKKTEAKMSAAVLLLRSSEKTITQIADELGYSSIEHFSSAFKRFYGVSARTYRKNMSASGISRSKPD